MDFGRFVGTGDELVIFGFCSVGHVVRGWVDWVDQICDSSAYENRMVSREWPRGSQ